MPPYVVEALAPLIALFGVGAFVLIGMKMRLEAKVRMQGSSGQGLEQLSEAVDQLREEVRSMRGEVLELQERVDFAERVLTKGQADRGMERRADTPV